MFYIDQQRTSTCGVFIAVRTTRERGATYLTLFFAIFISFLFSYILPPPPPPTSLPFLRHSLDQRFLALKLIRDNPPDASFETTSSFPSHPSFSFAFNARFSSFFSYSPFRYFLYHWIGITRKIKLKNISFGSFTRATNLQILLITFEQSKQRKIKEPRAQRGQGRKKCRIRSFVRSTNKSRTNSI